VLNAQLISHYWVTLEILFVLLTLLFLLMVMMQLSLHQIES